MGGFRGLFVVLMLCLLQRLFVSSGLCAWCFGGVCWTVGLFSDVDRWLVWAVCFLVSWFDTYAWVCWLCICVGCAGWSLVLGCRW